MAELSTNDHRALVADELALVRIGIMAVLRDLGLDVVAESHSGRELVSVAAVERPDLVVVGSPADLDVVETVRRLMKLRPVPRVVALLPPAHEHLVGYLLALGTRGLALRTTGGDDLTAVVEAVCKGEQHVAPALHRALAGAVRPRPLGEREEEVLTTREREVLAFLAEGRSNREIAAALSVALPTVKSHLVRIYAKLEASNRNEALGRAVALGLLA